jgi:cyclopropane-fatty-acyl-phospholipid synthase
MAVRTRARPSSTRPRPAARRHGDTLAEALDRLGVACELVLPSGRVLSFGAGVPEFRVVLRNGRLLRPPVTELGVALGYVRGDIDLEANGRPIALFQLRDVLRAQTPFRHLMSFLRDFALLAPTRLNSRVVDHHYSLGTDFYLTFLDARYHFYSQCLFHAEEETLEEAAEHKLESMWEALELEPGMRLLDIGGGWGGLTEYCGSRGVHVTSLTLSDASAAYIRDRIDRNDLLGEVIVEDVLDHIPSEPYDHAVIFGVIEHVPTYRRFCERLWDALQPGGCLYLDASATRMKYAASPFTRYHTWGGAHSCLALQDLTEELLFHGFELVRVRGETRDYELTMRSWAERLDAAEEEIVTRWGEPVFRSFRVFLWGGTHAFQTGRLQAYSLVAERRADPGPRPGNLHRFGNFLLSLR